LRFEEAAMMSLKIITQPEAVTLADCLEASTEDGTLIKSHDGPLLPEFESSIVVNLEKKQ
jgi:hypothetical protein